MKNPDTEKHETLAWETLGRFLGTVEILRNLEEYNAATVEVQAALLKDFKQIAKDYENNK